MFQGGGPNLYQNISDDSWSRRLAAAATAAGKATAAYERHGEGLTVRKRGQYYAGATPLTIWKETLAGPEMFAFGPSDLINMLDTAMGHAEQKMVEAKRSEKGLRGLIATLFRLPSEVRDAVGEEHKVQRTVAYSFGVMAQLAIVGVGGLLTSSLWWGTTVVVTHLLKK